MTLSVYVESSFKLKDKKDALTKAFKKHHAQDEHDGFLSGHGVNWISWDHDSEKEGFFSIPCHWDHAHAKITVIHICRALLDVGVTEFTITIS